ncbi:unnamed protein product [Spirodela intermedia]|uniref:Uncharacterized protein n=1 Tax=Spirodela intermedia TaxID=51605 RepID=A0A7I8JC75_SPIIN|nr:unnamed protein product [Spirodela intermedia]CAA6667744.1 unnamed protein product [Spirodela intermedia]
MVAAAGGSSLALSGPRPGAEWATVPYGGTLLAPPEGKQQRASSLESPIMLLTGHQSAVYTMKFNPSGSVIASGSHDRDIFLWNTTGDCKNFMVLRGHKNAVLEVQWMADGAQVISASADKTLRAWDVETGRQVKKMTEHLFGPPLVASGSDDGTSKLWDLRQRGSVQNLGTEHQITAVGFSDASDKVYTGGVDDVIKVWDLRRVEVVEKLQGHSDTITGMQLSPDGSYLLTNAMDCTLRIWDMRPYAPENRCVKIFAGHQHNFEKNLLRCGWSPDGSRVTAGSADRMVYLPGHTGSVNETAFHPAEPVIGSCSSDKQIFLGEI